MEIEVLKYELCGKRTSSLRCAIEECELRYGTGQEGAYAAHLTEILSMSITARAALIIESESDCSLQITVASYDHDTRLFMEELANLYQLDMIEL